MRHNLQPLSYRCHMQVFDGCEKVTNRGLVGTGWVALLRRLTRLTV